MLIQYPKLLKATASDDYILELEYSNNEKKRYDFKANFNHSYYKELKNPVLFKNFKIIDGDIEWGTGQDFCPHTLYDKSVIIKA